MGTLVSEPVSMENGVSESKHQEQQQPGKTDAGALFVLRSEGTWLHCGYHLTTSIVAPALLSLPFAFSSLGWPAGVICLAVGAGVTFYSYTLLSLVLEHHARLGRRHLRFRDLAYDVLGPLASKFYIGPVQFLVCYGAVVANILLGGQSLQSIYLMSRREKESRPGMRLYECVAIFGMAMLVLAQLPSFHSLRHINLVSLFLCLAYSTCATAGSIYAGFTYAANKSYTPRGGGGDRTFEALIGVAVIATAYGNGIIPEIQATAAAPVKGKMFKGLCLCYAIVVSTFFSVAISGFWAFGTQAQGSILANFLADDGRTALVPVWLLLMANTFTLLQLSAVAVVNHLSPSLQDTKRSAFLSLRLSSASVPMVAGLLAADERGAGRSVLGSGKGAVRGAERGAQADLEDHRGGDRDDRGGHAPLLRRHQRRHRRARIPPSRLRHPIRPLQPHLPPAQTQRRLLDQRRHRLRFLSPRLGRLRRRRPPDRPGRQVLSPLRRCLRAIDGDCISRRKKTNNFFSPDLFSSNQSQQVRVRHRCRCLLSVRKDQICMRLGARSCL